jgi:hypothetical protein
MRELISDLFVTTDSFAVGVAVGLFFGYVGAYAEAKLRR